MVKRSIRVLLVALTLLPLLAGCAGPSAVRPGARAVSVATDDSYSHGIGLFSGLSGPEPSQPETLVPVPSGRLLARVKLVNISNSARQVHRLVGLMDYGPVTLLAPDGSRLGTISLASGESRIIPIAVERVPAGSHAFTVCTFLSPDDHDTGTAFRDSSGTMFSSAQVETLVARGGSKRARPPLPEAAVASTKRADNGDLALGLRGRGFDRQLFSVEATAGGSLSCLIRVCNPETQRRSYVLTGFLDYGSLPIGGSRAVLVRLPAGTEKFVPLTVPVPQRRGIHELFVVEAREPFAVDPLEIALHSSIRTAVIVR